MSLRGIEGIQRMITFDIMREEGYKITKKLTTSHVQPPNRSSPKDNHVLIESTRQLIRKFLIFKSFCYMHVVKFFTYCDIFKKLNEPL